MAGLISGYLLLGPIIVFLGALAVVLPLLVFI